MKFTRDSIFSFGMSIVIALFVILSFPLSRVAKTIPLLVSIPTLTLILIQFLVDIMPRWEGKIEKYGGSLFTEQEEKAKTIAKDSIGFSVYPVDERESIYKTDKKELKMFSWIFGLFVLIYFIGYLVAVPLFLILYFKLRAREGWITSIGLTILVCGAMYTLFIFFLQVPLWKGALFGGLGF